MENRFDDLIREITARRFPMCDWLLIKAQVAQESSFNPDAKSPVGALGLLQVMPSTGLDFGLSGTDLLDPEKNLTAGIGYLAAQYGHLAEILIHEERVKFALASYNAGRGYINKAMDLAYQFEFQTPMPAGHRGARPGNWQEWRYTSRMLMSPACAVNGRTPDWKQAMEYVEKIWAGYLEYRAAAHAGNG